MDRLGVIQPQHRTENSYSSPDDPTLYPRIKGEGRINANQAGPLKRFSVRGDGDCFWRAFAAAYYHNENLYPQVKARTRYWVEYVLQQQNHIRHDLYDRLNVTAGTGVIEEDGQPRLNLQQQLRYAREWVSSEMFQTVVDCFDVELIIFKPPSKKETGWPAAVRGAHNRRQILLYMDFEGVHFDALLHNVQGRPRQDYRYRHHKTNAALGAGVFEDFPGERPEALIGMPLMLPLPNPLPPLRAMPAGERARLRKEQQRKGTKSKPVDLNDDDEGQRDGSAPGTPNAPIMIEGDDDGEPPPKKRKAGNGREGESGRAY